VRPRVHRDGAAEAAGYRDAELEPGEAFGEREGRQRGQRGRRPGRDVLAGTARPAERGAEPHGDALEAGIGDEHVRAPPDDQDRRVRGAHRVGQRDEVGDAAGLEQHRGGSAEPV
jgi:hypothetical protein